MTTHLATCPRNLARFTSLAAAILCVAVGCYADNQAPRSVPKSAPPPLKLSTLIPPLVVKLERTADWDKPLNFTAPHINNTVQIAAPSLDPGMLLAEPGEDVKNRAHEQISIKQAFDKTVNENDSDMPASVTIEEFADADVARGELVQTTWTAGEALHGAQIPTPVLIATGLQDGPRLCVTAAVHGDELNGIEAVRRLMYSIDPEKLTGSVVGVPIVNLQGFQRHSRYLSDRRDLNRFFPGNPKGSSASRMAFSFFNDIISTCDSLVDLHTGSFHRTNLPQLRADLQNQAVLSLTQGFGSTVILHSTGSEGTLRRAAVAAGIPAVTLEAGEPLRLQENAVEHTVKALFTLLDTLQMYNKRSLWGNPEPTYYSSSWVRADQGGILMSSVKLGKKVKAGDELGTITNPITNEQAPIQAPDAGRIIGMALNQFVMPGFATFHLATAGAPGEVDEEDEHYHADGLDLASNGAFGADESE